MEEARSAASQERHFGELVTVCLPLGQLAEFKRSIAVGEARESYCMAEMEEGCQDRWPFSKPPLRLEHREAWNSLWTST